MIPEGYGLPLLRRFVYSSCKPIAAREQLKLMLECGKRVFPFDYPETQVGRDFLHQRAFSQIETYCGLPPSKRPNYQVLKQPAPWFPQAVFSDADNFGIIVPLKRGYPKTNSMIYLPTEEDLKRLEDIEEQLTFEAEKGKFTLSNLSFNAEFAYVLSEADKSISKINLSTNQ